MLTSDWFLSSSSLTIPKTFAIDNSPLPPWGPSEEITLLLNTTYMSVLSSISHNSCIKGIFPPCELTMITFSTSKNFLALISVFTTSSFSVSRETCTPWSIVSNSWAGYIIPKNLAPLWSADWNAMCAPILASVSIGRAGPWFSKCDPSAIIPILWTSGFLMFPALYLNSAILSRYNSKFQISSPT